MTSKRSHEIASEFVGLGVGDADGVLVGKGGEGGEVGEVAGADAVGATDAPEVAVGDAVG